MSLDRFRKVQAAPRGGFETALAELRAGHKRSHWIWYIFPQLEGLGSSSNAQLYGLKDFSEACDYLREPVLGERLIITTQIVADQLDAGIALSTLMGSSIDCVKLVSSLTLFQVAAMRVATPELLPFAKVCESVIAAAERQGFERCRITLKRLEQT